MKKLTVLIIGATMMAACGGSSATTSDTSNTTVIVSESVPTLVTEAVTDTVPAAADDTVSAPTDTTYETTIETTGSSVAGALDPMAQLAATLGITDPADMKCITDNVAAAGGSGQPDATGMDPNLIKAVISCQPPSLVDLASQQILTRLPNLSPEAATCAAKATLKVLAAGESVDFSALTAGASAIPAELRAQLTQPITDCGLSEADINAYLGG